VYEETNVAAAAASTAGMNAKINMCVQNVYAKNFIDVRTTLQSGERPMLSSCALFLARIRGMNGTVTQDIANDGGL
jgi:hypothetical protein